MEFGATKDWFKPKIKDSSFKLQSYKRKALSVKDDAAVLIYYLLFGRKISNYKISELIRDVN